MLSTKLYDINGLSSHQTITTSVHVHLRTLVGRWTCRQERYGSSGEQTDMEIKVGKQTDLEES